MTREELFNGLLASPKDSAREIERLLQDFREACAQRDDDQANEIEEEILALAASLELGGGTRLGESEVANEDYSGEEYGELLSEDAMRLRLRAIRAFYSLT